MNKRQYIGVTGITTVGDVGNMTNALAGHLGMYGVLMRTKTFGMTVPERKWTTGSDVSKLMQRMPSDALKTIHWCEPKFSASDVNRAIELCGGYCNAIQLNMVYPPVRELISLKKAYQDMQIIFQIEKSMFESPKEMKKKIGPYSSAIDYVIIDQSMGAGILIDHAVSRSVAKDVVQKLGLGVVLAGGLNSKRVREIGPLIRKFSASIDAEGQLMNLEKRLDDSKVAEYIKAAAYEMFR